MACVVNEINVLGRSQFTDFTYLSKYVEKKE